MPRTIAIVEDDPDQLTNYADALRRRGYAVQTYATRPDAEAGFAQVLPDLAILDIVLGDEIDGGFTLCRHLMSKAPRLPVIFLTDRSSEVDKVSGLLLAWDYVPKPISLEFLVAMVATLFRILAGAGEPGDEERGHRRGALEIDLRRVRITWRDTPVRLTVTEFDIVFQLARRPGHVVTYQALMEATRQTIVTKNTIATHVRRIRDKFAALDPAFACIENEYGLGYRWRESA